jgi:hypothetical protein
MSLALLLTLSVLSIPTMAETESDDGGAIGYGCSSVLRVFTG